MEPNLPWQHTWSLKDQNEEPELEWEEVCRAAPHQSAMYAKAKTGTLFLSLKNATLNRRKELFNHCCHKERLLIV